MNNFHIKIQAHLFVHQNKWIQIASFPVNYARAKRVFDTEDEAKEFKADNPKWVVEHRPAEPLRCQSYCDVAKFCTQYMEEEK